MEVKGREKDKLFLIRNWSVRLRCALLLPLCSTTNPVRPLSRQTMRDSNRRVKAVGSGGGGRAASCFEPYGCVPSPPPSCVRPWCDGTDTRGGGSHLFVSSGQEAATFQTFHHPYPSCPMVWGRDTAVSAEYTWTNQHMFWRCTLAWRLSFLVTALTIIGPGGLSKGTTLTHPLCTSLGWVVVLIALHSVHTDGTVS
jgi:hypothetical protein